MSKVWFVGERNPYGSDPRLALYPQPSNATGGRLARVLGMTDNEYLDAFERRNLLVGEWNILEARKAADALLAEHPRGDKLVLLGAKVAEAFYVAFRENLCAPRPTMALGNCNPCIRAALVLPHPSGLSRLWNERGMADRVRIAVEHLRLMTPSTPC